MAIELLQTFALENEIAGRARELCQSPQRIFSEFESFEAIA